jgi:DNA-directed RNA polymerase subunit RPC12/RpoP
MSKVLRMRFRCRGCREVFVVADQAISASATLDCPHCGYSHSAAGITSTPKSNQGADGPASSPGVKPPQGSPVRPTAATVSASAALPQSPWAPAATVLLGSAEATPQFCPQAPGLAGQALGHNAPGPHSSVLPPAFGAHRKRSGWLLWGGISSVLAAAVGIVAVAIPKSDSAKKIDPPPPSSPAVAQLLGSIERERREIEALEAALEVEQNQLAEDAKLARQQEAEHRKLQQEIEPVQARYDQLTADPASQ